MTNSTSRRDRIHNRRRGNTTLIVISLGTLALSVIGLAWAFWPGSTASNTDNIITAKSELGPFKHIVIAEGEVESSENVEIRCEVKSRNSSGTVILDVVPEGTRVVEGDQLVRLDDSALQQELLQQQIVCNTSKAIMIQAQNIYEAAEIAKLEYTEGTFRQEEQLILSEQFVAQENLRRALQYSKYSERLAAKGYVTALQLEGDRFAVDKSQNELDTASTKLNVLREYTQAKMLKQLGSDITTGEAKWKAEQNSYQLELDKLKDIQDQIAKCVIFAPQAGTVVHANEYGRSGNSEFVVEAGATIRERQVIIRLPDPQKMQIKAKINEARITLVTENVPVSIIFDAASGETNQGTVVKVNQYAEPRGWSSGPIREYAAFIQIHNPPDVIRPGMSAEVQILVEHIENALQVPVQVLEEHRGHFFCVVQTGDKWLTKEVEVGVSNDKFMTIENGLEAGDNVVMNPRGYDGLLQLPDIPEPEVSTPPVRSNAPVTIGKGKKKKGPAKGQGAPGFAGRPKGGVGPGGAGSGGGAPGGGGERPSAGQIVNSIFQRIDTDGDGMISSAEISSTPAQQQEMMKQADANGDGNITRAELTSAFAKMRESRQP